MAKCFAGRRPERTGAKSGEWIAFLKKPWDKEGNAFDDLKIFEDLLGFLPGALSLMLFFLDMPLYLPAPLVGLSTLVGFMYFNASKKHPPFWSLVK